VDNTFQVSKGLVSSAIKGTPLQKNPNAAGAVWASSMRELENDAYVRKTSGYLPEASVAFVDEIFKANSAILNTLLTILNERSFDNGNQRYQIPLMCMVSLPRATAVFKSWNLLMQSYSCLQSLLFKFIQSNTYSLFGKSLKHSTWWHPQN